MTLICRLVPAGASLGLILSNVGCTSPRIDRELSDIPLGSRYQPSNLYSVPELPKDFRRVAILPVHLEKDSEADPKEINSIILAELRRIGRFEIVEVSPDILFSLIGTSRLSTLAPFPEDLMTYLQSQLKADGVLQTDLTSYRPYRPFEVGIRSRLFDLNTNSPLWAVDEVLNAGNKKVYTGSRHYSLGQVHNKYPFEDSYSALRSPNRFTAYSALTIFQTIPGYSAASAF
ncbi:MAG: hypothetical protein O7C75_03170 [Verrucomicrobia bacterium]|nr:hypothetical protein [Verrucomicrobiota bacterium]